MRRTLPGFVDRVDKGAGGLVCGLQDAGQVARHPVFMALPDRQKIVRALCIALGLRINAELAAERSVLLLYDPRLFRFSRGAHVGAIDDEEAAYGRERYQICGDQSPAQPMSDFGHPMGAWR